MKPSLMCINERKHLLLNDVDAKFAAYEESGFPKTKPMVLTPGLCMLHSKVEDYTLNRAI